MGQGAPCGSNDCNVCNICLRGFKLKKNLGRTAKAKNSSLRYGKGVYFSSLSGKANKYAENSQKVTVGDFFALVIPLISIWTWALLIVLILVLVLIVLLWLLSSWW